MERDPRKYLWDARRAAEQVIAYVQGKAFDDLMADRMFRDAVERQLQNTGEAIAQLARLEPATAERIPAFRQIIAFRNILVHRYDALDYDAVWRIIHEDLPKLVTEIDGLLGDR